jgi:hypothetical protein
MRRQDRTLVVNTRELREICRDTKRRGYNRNLKPQQFALLDPKGTHILGVRLIHKHKDEQPCEPHVRVFAHIKLLGQQKAIERYIDIAMDYVSPYFDAEEMFDPDSPDIKKFLAENANKLDELNAEDLPERFQNVQEVVDEIKAMAAEDRPPAEGTFVSIGDDAIPKSTTEDDS